MIGVQVPGKVMLSGEYAVLYGGMAVLAPIKRYLILTESNEQSTKPYSPMITQGLGHPIEELRGYEAAHGIPQITIDDQEFYLKGADGQNLKLGLGLSAAESVGAIALRFEWAGFSWPQYRDRIFEVADKVHRTVQGGLGSGADVAACAYAEPIRYRRQDEKSKVESLKGDQQTPLFLLWSGRTADTRSYVSQFHAWVRSGGSKSRFMLDRLILSGNLLAQAWFSSPLGQLYEFLDRFNAHLLEAAKSAGLQLRLPIHERISDWAKRNGGRAKSVGSGGGDMILLIGDLPIQRLSEKIYALD